MKISLIDERVSEKIERRLQILGFLPIRMPKSDALPSDVASHPDILLFKDGNTVITSASYAESALYVFSDLREHRDDLRLVFSSDDFGNKYPRDAIFNALVMGRYIFLKEDSISKSVLEYADENRLIRVNVKQGYPRCTVLPLNDKMAITSDKGMAKALHGVGVNVLTISEGQVSLPTREYGFIGGAAGVFENTVYFLGSIEKHPDFEKIRDFIALAGMDFVSLSDEMLFDGGTILFL